MFMRLNPHASHPVHVADPLRAPVELGPNPELDLVMDLARRVFRVPHCTVSWLSPPHLWQTHTPGEPPACFTPADTLCHLAIRLGRPVIHSDLLAVPELASHPMVRAEPAAIRFFASAPLYNLDGTVVGALSLADSHARDALDPSWHSEIEEFATLAMGAIEHERLSRERDQDLQLFASGPMVALVWDDGSPPRLRSLSGNLPEVLGHKLSRALQEGEAFERIIEPRDLASFRIALRSHGIDQQPRLEINYRLRGGRRWVRQITHGDYDLQGRLLRVRGYLVDITRQKDLESSLEHTKERLCMALESSNIGTWDMDFKTSKRLVSSRTAVMLGMRPDEFEMDLSHWISLVHPFDRTRVQNVLLEGMPAGDGTQRTPVFSVQYRIRHKAGHHIWVQSSGRLVNCDEQGKPERAVGTIIDITEVKQAEMRRHKQQVLLDLVNSVQRSFLLDRNVPEACEALFKPLLQLTESQFGFIGIARRDPAGRLSLEMPSVYRMVPGADRSEVIAATARGVVMTDLENVFGRVVCANTTEMRNVPSGVAEHGGVIPGQPELESLLCMPLSFNGQALGMIALGNRLEGYDQDLQDLLQPLVLTLGTLLHARELEDQRLAMEEQLKRHATQDTLTGLFNRRRFFESLGDQLLQSRRYKAQMTLALMDVDHFKQVNDRYGHAGGDAVLRALAEVLRQVMRDTDVVARIGGEEIALLLTCTDVDSAMAALERLRESVEHMAVPFEGAFIRVTASIGAMGWHDQLRDAAHWMHCADMALYRAKALGRNRIEIEDPSLTAADAPPHHEPSRGDASANTATTTASPEAPPADPPTSSAEVLRAFPTPVQRR